MFDLSKLEKVPVLAVVRAVRAGKTEAEIEVGELPGKWWRVLPSGESMAREVNALRMLAHREEKFAPAKGHGVLISDDAMKTFRAGIKRKRAFKPTELDEILTPKLPPELNKRRPVILSPAQAGIQLKKKG
jgi:hypothetical protein